MWSAFGFKWACPPRSAWKDSSTKTAPCCGFPKMCSVNWRQHSLVINDLSVNEVAFAPIMPASSRGRVSFFPYAQKKTNWFDNLLFDADRLQKDLVISFGVIKITRLSVQLKRRPLQLSPLVWLWLLRRKPDLLEITTYTYLAWYASLLKHHPAWVPTRLLEDCLALFAGNAV